MALVESNNLKMGRVAEDFSLIGVDGKIHGLKNFDQAKVLVIVFMCNHCPYVQAIWSRLVGLQSEFQASGVQFLGINPNTANESYEEETLEKMKEYADQYQMNFPYLEDAGQKVARLYEAECTPDIYVYDGARKLVYHGRLDDNWKDESEVRERDLAQAIVALLEGGRPNSQQKPSMGCSIKWI